MFPLQIEKPTTNQSVSGSDKLRGQAMSPSLQETDSRMVPSDATLRFVSAAGQERRGGLTNQSAQQVCLKSMHTYARLTITVSCEGDVDLKDTPDRKERRVMTPTLFDFDDTLVMFGLGL